MVSIDTRILVTFRKVICDQYELLNIFEVYLLTSYFSDVEEAGGMFSLQNIQIGIFRKYKYNTVYSDTIFRYVYINIYIYN